MNFEKFVTFVGKNLDFFEVDDVKMIIHGKYSSLINSLNSRYQTEQDRRKKAKLEYIVGFLMKFLNDYNKFSFKYDYDKCASFDSYKYWFDYYLKNNFLTKSEQVLSDIKMKFPEQVKSIQQLEKSFEKKKRDYSAEFGKIKSNVEKSNQLKYIEMLVGQGNYGQAMFEVLKCLKEYPNDPQIKEYLKRIDKLKSSNLLQQVDLNKGFFEKVGLLSLTKTDILKKSDISSIYGKLNFMISNSDYEGGLMLIKYVKEKFKLEDPKLVKYYNKFIELKSKIHQKKQGVEYNLELKSLRLLVKNKQYQDATIKSNSILKKYPFIDKNEVFKVIQQINRERTAMIRGRNKSKADQWLDDMMMRISPLSKKQLLVFYEKMAWFLRAKMDIKLSMQVVYYQVKEYGLKSFVKGLLDGLDSGMKLSEILRWNKMVKKMDIALIKIGEATGKLGDMFQLIHTAYKKQADRAKKIKSVMIYPAVVISITLVIFVLLILFIIPKFVDFFATSGVELPAITRFFIRMSKVLQSHWYVFVGLITFFIIFFSVFSKTNMGKFVMGFIYLKLPVVKQIIFKSYVIYFASNLSLLLNAGIPLLEAIDLLIYGAENVFYQDEFKRIRFELETGVSFSKSVGLGSIDEVNSYTNSYIPIDLAYAIDIGERTGQLGDLLGEVSERYEDDLNMLIKNLQNLMEPFIIVLLGTFIFAFVMAIFMPMLKMYSVVGKMGGL
ncbi:MAG: type II secretion system F family protein [Candidatus Absconditabacteria bacterium]